MSFAKKIKSLRNQHNLSQDEFGKIIGVHGRHISKYEQGKVLPNADILIKLYKHFDISIDYLLLSDDELNKNASIINNELKRKIKILEEMPEEDKKTIIAVIDAFINQK